MGATNNWARGSRQHVARLRPAGRAESTCSPSSTTPSDPVDIRRRIEDTGITWASFDVEAIKPSAVDRACARFQALLPDLVWNAAALEGNTFTLPEVRTLLDGTTVGGRPLGDEKQILALAAAYTRLDEMVRTGEFTLSKSVSDELHGLVAEHEAIESGNFRGEGGVTGGGIVRLARGGVVPGTDHGEGGQALRDHYDDLLDHLTTVTDARRRALIYFASAVRRQFYFDGNKRTARLMMAGELMSSAYDAVSVPFERRLEFNQALDTLFDQDDGTSLLSFLGTCTID